MSITIIVIATFLVVWTTNVRGSLGGYEFNNEVTLEVNGEDVFFEILQPRELGYTYRIRPAQDFGIPFNASVLGPDMALVPVEPETGCTKPDNIEQLTGNVALVWRGDCTFFQKAAVAEDAGAKAAIIADYYAKSIDDERNSPLWMDYYYIDMTSDDSELKRDINIPVGFLLGKNGKMIKNTLKRLNLSHARINIPLNLTFAPLTDFHQPPWVAV